MKAHQWNYSLKIVLLATLSMFSSCSFFIAGYLRNMTNEQVIVKLYFRELDEDDQKWFTKGLRYLPVLQRPSARLAYKLKNTLPVVTTATSATFYLPARSVVSLGGGEFLAYGKGIRLQRADSSIQTLDSMQLAQAVHWRWLGGPRVWYDIQEKVN